MKLQIAKWGNSLALRIHHEAPHFIGRSRRYDVAYVFIVLKQLTDEVEKNPPARDVRCHP